MQITLYSLLMSVLCSSVLAVFNHICRKKHFLIRQLGAINVWILYLLCMVRMLVPYKFSFTKVIQSKGAFHDICEGVSVGQAESAGMSLLSILAILWGTVAAVLMIRFAWQYGKAMREFSAYRVCEDTQCKRIFQQVWNRSKRQINIAVRHSDQVNVPMGAGIFRKTIILPEEIYNDVELYHILRHEYTHFQNRDLLLKVLVHIYGCIFWWNPAIYLIKKDLAQILEIKCDLDVTEHMEREDKAAYLTTIVMMLKRAGDRRSEAFYGTTALFADYGRKVKGRKAKERREKGRGVRGYEGEIIERFQMVSGSYRRKRKSGLVAGAWFFVFTTFVLASYSFVIQPGDEGRANGNALGEELDQRVGAESEFKASYTVKVVDGMYYVYFQ